MKAFYRTNGYETLNKKVVCGVPASAVPAWLKARITDNPVNNLGAYVRPEYRDVTYFYGIDFHQDLIDYKAREADFVTLYIYLHPVTRADAPLFLLEGSPGTGKTTGALSFLRAGAAAGGSENEAASGASELVPAGAALYGEATLDPSGDQKQAINSILAKFPGGGGSGGQASMCASGSRNASGSSPRTAGTCSGVARVNSVMMSGRPRTAAAIAASWAGVLPAQSIASG